MAHLLAFGFEVAPARFVGTGDTRHPFGNDHPGVFKGPHLIRVIREKPHRADAEMPQNSAGQLIIPQIALESELFVGFHGVGPQILQPISAQLIHQPDASAFLQFVDDQSPPFFGDLLEGDFELRPAVAAQTVENIAGEALGMNTEQRGRAGAAHIAHRQGDRFFQANPAVGKPRPPLETEDSKGSVFGGKVGLRGFQKLEIDCGVTGGLNNFIIMSRRIEQWNST